MRVREPPDFGEAFGVRLSVSAPYTHLRSPEPMVVTVQIFLFFSGAATWGPLRRNAHGTAPAINSQLAAPLKNKSLGTRLALYKQATPSGVLSTVIFQLPASHWPAQSAFYG